MAAVLGSVVVGDFDFAGIAARPAETETPLIIDADAVLAGTLAFERFKPVAGRDPEVFKGVGTGKQVEFIFNLNHELSSSSYVDQLGEATADKGGVEAIVAE